MHNVRRILVVEDDAHVRFFLSQALSSLGDGYEVVAKENGVQALAVIETTDLDLLVTDVSLPGLDGKVLTKSVRRQRPDLPVIWLTSISCNHIERQALGLDVAVVIEKPVEIATLRAAAQGVLKRTERFDGGHDR